MPRGYYQRKAPKPLADRLMAMSMPIPEAGCWVFTGCLNKNGYGRFTTKTNQNLLAHRVAYEAFVCDIPPGMGVLHKCDVRSCINPDHLVLGSHAENMRDMAAKGRAQAGEKHKGAKLTEDDVRKIRLDPDGCTRVARKFGVGPMTILDVRAGRTWKHVD